MPRNDLTFLAVLVWGKVSIAVVFKGLVRIPDLDIRKPRYSISAAANLHLEGCKVKLAALRF